MTELINIAERAITNVENYPDIRTQAKALVEEFIGLVANRIHKLPRMIKEYRKFRCTEYLNYGELIAVLDRTREGHLEEPRYKFICVICINYKKEDTPKLVQNGAICKECWDKAVIASKASQQGAGDN